MKVEIPGQFRGPECRALVPVAIGLRKQLEPLVADMPPSNISTVSFILRVGGTLGEFEPLPSTEPELSRGSLVYDIVVPSHDWARLAANEIRSALCVFLRPALSHFVLRAGLSAEQASAILAIVDAPALSAV